MRSQFALHSKMVATAKPQHPGTEQPQKGFMPPLETGCADCVLDTIPPLVDLLVAECGSFALHEASHVAFQVGAPC